MPPCSEFLNFFLESRFSPITNTLSSRKKLIREHRLQKKSYQIWHPPIYFQNVSLFSDIYQILYPLLKILIPIWIAPPIEVPSAVASSKGSLLDKTILESSSSINFKSCRLADNLLKVTSPIQVPSETAYKNLRTACRTISSRFPIQRIENNIIKWKLYGYPPRMRLGSPIQILLNVARVMQSADWLKLMLKQKRVHLSQNIIWTGLAGGARVGDPINYFFSISAFEYIHWKVDFKRMFLILIKKYLNSGYKHRCRSIQT